MDELTKKGLWQINEHENRLRAFAHAKIADGAADDDWFGYNVAEHRPEQDGDKQEDCVDVNVWLHDEIGKVKVWKAAAYPMEINGVGEIQTNGGDFIELF